MMGNRSDSRGRLVADLIPDPLTYFAAQGLHLAGRGRQRMGQCPIHGGSDSLSVDTATGRFLCFACGAKGGDMLDLHRQVHGLSFIAAARDLGALVEGSPSAPLKRLAKAHRSPQAEPRSDAEMLGHVRELWAKRQPVAGTVGESYLHARGCMVPPADGDLMFCPALRHPSSHVGAALLARITSAETGEPMGLHRTWITATGKAGVKPAKMTLGPKQGGVIRLWPDEAVTTGLAVAEGIETCLSIARDYRPVWCAVDAGNLGALPVLPGIECLVIGADNDANGTGIREARRCADRWAAAGVDVRVIVPDAAGADWNDAEGAQ